MAERWSRRIRRAGDRPKNAVRTVREEERIAWRGRSTLPGIGERFDFNDARMRPFAVVARHDGSCVVHAGDVVLELPAPVARAVGLILADRYAVNPAVVDQLAGVLGGLVIDGMDVAAGSAAAGRSIAELGVRTRTGVSIVAIVRQGLPIVAPDPDERLAAGDRLVVAGRGSDLPGLAALVGRR